MAVCARIRRILDVAKAGHAGTLDPMAEGVLPVALGRACKSCDEAGGGRKTYRAGMLLGVTTDTQDVTGTELSRYEGELPSEEEIRNVLLSFVGDYDQLTPMYSARQVDGKRLYEIVQGRVERGPAVRTGPVSRGVCATGVGDFAPGSGGDGPRRPEDAARALRFRPSGSPPAEAHRHADARGALRAGSQRRYALRLRGNHLRTSGDGSGPSREGGGFAAFDAAQPEAQGLRVVEHLLARQKHRAVAGFACRRF